MSHPKILGALRALLMLVLCGGAIAWAYRNATLPADAPEQVGALTHMLAVGSVNERKFALSSMQPVEPAEMDLAVAAATRALRDQDPSVRIEAATTLARFATFTSGGKSPVDVDRAREIALSLQEEYRREQDTTVRVVAAGGVSSIVAALTKAGARPGKAETDPLQPESLAASFDAGLKDDPANRVSLIAAIEQLGKLSLAAPPGLLSMLDDPTHSVRGQALLALTHFNGGADRAVPVLLHDVATNADRYPPDYAAIAGALHPSPDTVPTLVEAFHGDNSLVRQMAAAMICRIEPPPRTAAPTLIAAVKKELAIAETARGGGDAPDPASVPAPGGPTPGSANRLDRPAAGSVSPVLAVALARVALPDEAVPLLVQLSKRKGSDARGAAAEGLADIGPAAHSAIPVLIANLKDALANDRRSSSGFGSKTARALGRIAPHSPEAQSTSGEVLAVLTEALNSRSADIRAAAVDAMGDFGTKAAPALPRIRELMEDRSATVRDAAKSSVEKIESASSPAIDAKS